MMNAFYQYLHTIAHNHLVLVVALCVALDTILGCLRAIKEHTFNSSFGINGAIRKAGVLISVLFFMLADALIGINIVAFVNADIRQTIGLTKAGLGEFFCIVYILYEAVSILKNLKRIGIPIPAWAEKVLSKYLQEITSDTVPGSGGGSNDVSTN